MHAHNIIDMMHIEWRRQLKEAFERTAASYRELGEQLKLALDQDEILRVRIELQQTHDKLASYKQRDDDLQQRIVKYKILYKARPNSHPGTTINTHCFRLCQVATGQHY